jgi:predicted RNase H-like nuclease
MATVAGADGCPGGWIAVWTGDRHGHALVPTAAALLDVTAHADLLVVDVPIGLSEAAPRACDVAARRLLGRQGASVFAAPVRPALRASDHRTAHDRTRAARAAAGLPEKGISIQAWNLFAKVRDVDAVMTPALQSRVREGHPELGFRLWAGGPLPSKKTHDGRAARRALVERRYGSDALTAARDAYRVRDVAHDDLLDAFACLRIAERALAGDALVLPEGEIETDVKGLRMEILG